MKKIVVTALLSAVLAVPASSPAAALDAPRDLKWAELKPPRAAGEAEVKKPKTFFNPAEPAPAGGDAASQSADVPPPPDIPEGKFMAVKRRQPGAGHPPKIVADLNGQRVKLGGYVVPLDFEATKVKEFLLVPFVGACIHVPPPPPNQIVYVKAEKGIDIAGSFDPVAVTGIISTESASTGLADAGYTITADAIEPWKP